MPRVVLSDQQRTRDAVAGVIAKYQAIYRLKKQDTAKAADMVPQSLRRRLKNPDTFTIGELKSIMRSLRIPKEEILAAMFGTNQ